MSNAAKILAKFLTGCMYFLSGLNVVLALTALSMTWTGDADYLSVVIFLGAVALGFGFLGRNISKFRQRKEAADEVAKMKENYNRNPREPVYTEVNYTGGSYTPGSIPSGEFDGTLASLVKGPEKEPEALKQGEYRE